MKSLKLFSLISLTLVSIIAAPAATLAHFPIVAGNDSQADLDVIELDADQEKTSDQDSLEAAESESENTVEQKQDSEEV